MNSISGSTNLGQKLKATRLAKGLSLHAVAKPAKISATYLKKLESGVVNNPSPHVLLRLAEVLGIAYLKLMEFAGYLPPAPDQMKAADQGGRLDKILIEEDLSEEEWQAVAAFIRYLKDQRRKS